MIFLRNSFTNCLKINENSECKLTLNHPGIMGYNKLIIQLIAQQNRPIYFWSHRHDIADIFLKVSLITITLIPYFGQRVIVSHQHILSFLASGQVTTSIH